MYCKIQPRRVLALLVIQWMSVVHSTNTTGLYYATAGNLTTPSYNLSTANATENGNITTPLPTVFNVTSPANTANNGSISTPHPTLFNITSSANTTNNRNITTPHPTVFNVTSPENTTTNRNITTPPPTALNVTLHNATASVNMTTNHTGFLNLTTPAGVTVSNTSILATPHNTNASSHRVIANTTSHGIMNATVQMMTTATPSSLPSCPTPCHLYATCVARQSGNTCVCSAGYQGSGTVCNLVAQQVRLEMTMNLPYTSDLADSNSQAFRDLAQRVSSKIYSYLSGSTSGLLGVTVSSFRPGSVVAAVNANFQQNVSVSAEGVVSSLKQAVANDTSNPLGLNTSSISVCPPGGCGVAITTAAPMNATVGHLANSTANLMMTHSNITSNASIPTFTNTTISGNGTTHSSPLNVTLPSNVTMIYNTTVHGNTTYPYSPTLPLNFTAPVNVTYVPSFPNGTTSGNQTTTMSPFMLSNTTTPMNVTEPITSPLLTTPKLTTHSPVTDVPPCQSSCHIYASCVRRRSGSTCVCSAGYQGNGITCSLVAQQVRLEMAMNLPYTSDLADFNSQAFRDLAQRVSSKIYSYLSGSTSGLLGVTVSSFRPGSVVAAVNANFQQNVSVSAEGVVSSLKQAVANDTGNPLGLNTSSIALCPVRGCGVGVTTVATQVMNVTMSARNTTINIISNNVTVSGNNATLSMNGTTRLPPMLHNTTAALNATTGFSAPHNTTKLPVFITNGTSDVNTTTPGHAQVSFNMTGPGNATTAPVITTSSHSLLNVTTPDNVATTPLHVTTGSPASSCSTPCHLYASCVARQSGHTCVCSSGYQGNGVTCTLVAQQVSLEMTMNLPYTSDLADSNSQAFRDLAQRVSSKIFAYLSTSTSGLLGVTVSSFRPGSVVAAVNANFQQNMSVSAEGVVSSLKQAVANDTGNPLALNASSISVCPAGGCGVVITTAAPQNTTAAPSVRTVGSVNVTDPRQAVTVRDNVTSSRDNVTVVMITTPVVSGINTTRRPDNITQGTPLQTVSIKMTLEPAANLTTATPNRQNVTMAAPGTSPASPMNGTTPAHAPGTTASRTQLPGTIASRTQPPTTTAKPATTAATFPACTTQCHRYASCVAGASGKSCVCNAGYSGDGATCTLASKKVNLEMRMTSVPFTEDLKNRNSAAFRSLSFKVSKQIFAYLRSTPLGGSLLSVTILSFRKGSVVTNYNANFKSNATVSDSGVSSALQQAITSDPNNTFGIDVSSLCTKTNEDAACGATTGLDQNLIIGLAVCVPIVVIILIIIVVFLIKRALNKNKQYTVGKESDKKAESKDKDDDEDSKKGIEMKDVKLECGEPARTIPSATYAMKPATYDPPRNYKRMTFQPAMKAGPANKYEHDLGGTYFPNRYKMPQEPKPAFHYVEGHVQGKPVTAVIPI